jgi:hypothetical protein
MEKENKSGGGGGADKFDTLSFIMAYETGMASEDDIIEGFTSLIKTGVINGLQGHYQRTAMALVAAGYIEVAS